MTARWPPTFDDRAHKYCRRTWSCGQLPRQDAYARTRGRFRRLTGGRRRALVFSETLPDDVPIELLDHSGRALRWSALAIDGDTVRANLASASAGLVSDGGRLQVRLNNNDDFVSVTWPYNLAHLRSRLDKASHREHLPRIGDLPEHDAELYELLQELDQTLIIDRTSVWRIAKPKDPPHPESDDATPAPRCHQREPSTSRHRNTDDRRRRELSVGRHTPSQRRRHTQSPGRAHDDDHYARGATRQQAHRRMRPRAHTDRLCGRTAAQRARRAQRPRHQRRCRRTRDRHPAIKN